MNKQTFLQSLNSNSIVLKRGIESETFSQDAFDKTIRNASEHICPVFGDLHSAPYGFPETPTTTWHTVCQLVRDGYTFA